MDILSLLNKHYAELKVDSLFQYYFKDKTFLKGNDSYSVNNENLGISLHFNEKFKSDVLFLYSGLFENFRKYTGALPFNLNWNFYRKDVVKMFGSPFASGGGQESLIYDLTPLWDKYSIAGIFLHLQYEKSKERIELITFSIT